MLRLLEDVVGFSRRVEEAIAAEMTLRLGKESEYWDLIQSPADIVEM